MKLIYISIDWIFTTAINTPHFHSLWVHSFFPFAQCQFSNFILYSCGFYFFFLFGAKPHIYLCKCNFYEKVFLYEENQSFVMIFINTKHTMRVSSMAEGWYSRLVVQKGFLDTYTQTHPRVQGTPILHGADSNQLILLI